MARATVTIELLREDKSGERLLHCLDIALKERCSNIVCSIVRREEFPIVMSFDESVNLAVQNVVSALPPVLPGDSQDERWGIYLVPRRMDFYLQDVSIQTSLNGVVMAIAAETRPVAVYLQSIALAEVPEPIAMTLHHKMALAKNRLIRTRITQEQADVVIGFKEAILNAYSLAFSPTSLQ